MSYWYVFPKLLIYKGNQFLDILADFPIMRTVMKRNVLRALMLLTLSLALEIAGETLPGALWAPSSKDNVTWITLS